MEVAVSEHELHYEAWLLAQNWAARHADIVERFPTAIPLWALSFVAWIHQRNASKRLATSVTAYQWSAAELAVLWDEYTEGAL